MYKKIDAVNRFNALLIAKRLCRCERMSFEGVCWEEAGERQEMGWEEIDLTRPSRMKRVEQDT